MPTVSQTVIFINIWQPSGHVGQQAFPTFAAEEVGGSIDEGVGQVRSGRVRWDKETALLEKAKEVVTMSLEGNPSPPRQLVTAWGAKPPPKPKQVKDNKNWERQQLMQMLKVFDIKNTYFS